MQDYKLGMSDLGGIVAFMLLFTFPVSFTAGGEVVWITSVWGDETMWYRFSRREDDWFFAM